MNRSPRPSRTRQIALALSAFVASLGSLAWAQPVGQKSLPSDGLDLIEHTGEQIPLNLVFRNSDNQSAPLANWFDDDRPVVLALLYYRCPVVCTVIMERLLESFNGLDYQIGNDFNVVFVSIDETENPTIADAKKQELLADYVFGADTQTQNNWAFLTGEPEAVKQLADAIGYQFRRMDNGEYTHPVAFAIVSPTGTITRYMYGYEYPSKQMKLALLEASEGKITRSLGDRVLQFCFRFDPTEGAYTLQAMRVMQLGGILTVIFLVVLIGGYLLMDGRRKRRALKANEHPSGAHSDSSGLGRLETKMGHES